MAASTKVAPGKIARYRKVMHDLTGEAAKLGQEIHDAERAGKPRALTADTAVKHSPQRPPRRRS